METFLKSEQKSEENWNDFVSSSLAGPVDKDTWNEILGETKEDKEEERTPSPVSPPLKRKRLHYPEEYDQMDEIQKEKIAMTGFKKLCREREIRKVKREKKSQRRNYPDSWKLLTEEQKTWLGKTAFKRLTKDRSRCQNPEINSNAPNDETKETTDMETKEEE